MTIGILVKLLAWWLCCIPMYYCRIFPRVTEVVHTIIKYLNEFLDNYKTTWNKCTYYEFFQKCYCFVSFLSQNMLRQVVDVLYKYMYMTHIHNITLTYICYFLWLDYRYLIIPSLLFFCNFVMTIAVFITII